MPKYLNSPETTLLISEKRCLTLIKPEKKFVKENTVLLLEGFMDVIAAWQSGVKVGWLQWGLV